MEMSDYKHLISEIIHKQIDILGQDIAVAKAGNVKGLKVSGTGEVLEVGSDPEQILDDLVAQYIALSGEIVKNILGPVFSKYPEIKLNSLK